MSVASLPQENLAAFLEGLRTFGEVLVPERRADGGDVFVELTDPGKVAVNYTRTILPLKKLFFPAVDQLFTFSTRGGYQTAHDEESKKSRIVFGAHTCDIEALQRLDLTLLRGYVDPYYQARRQNTTLIGLSCHPDEACFCQSVDADFVHDGYDLFFTAISTGFHVQIGTTRGHDLVRAMDHLFVTATTEDLHAYKRYIKDRAGEFDRTMGTSALPKILELERDADVWTELGEKCLGCGSCSMVCPTCHCFSVFDLIDLDSDHGQRMRRWDSCLYKEFALVAGGHNFRPTRAMRIRQRIFHKHKDFPERYSRSGCVGCGRCTVSCPAGIDFVKVIQRLRREENA